MASPALLEEIAAILVLLSSGLSRLSDLERRLKEEAHAAASGIDYAGPMGAAASSVGAMSPRGPTHRVTEDGANGSHEPRSGGKHGPFYKTVLCRHEQAAPGSCHKGAACTYAHSTAELDYHRGRSLTVRPDALGRLPNSLTA